MTNSHTIHCDVVIIGGGITGLWLLNKLRQQGYQALLLERNQLGLGQTRCAQGIIHGGMKYSLIGKLTGSAKAIATMPARWQACLQGEGEINLSQVKPLSNQYYLCPTGQLTAKVANFFANKCLASHSEALTASEYSPFFQHYCQTHKLKSKIYRVKETVIDCYSLVEQLAFPHQDAIYQLPDQAELTWQQQPNGTFTGLTIKSPGQALTFSAQAFLCTAGQGNKDLTQTFIDPPPMQLRPLHMAYLSWPKEHAPPAVFTHFVGHRTVPLLTITTHATATHRIWYVGGQFAEEGVNFSTAQQCARLIDLMKEQFPWVDCSQAEVASFPINRAELAMANGQKPDCCTIERRHNCWVVWPTKLTFAPLVGDQILASLAEHYIAPQHTTLACVPWQKPDIAPPPWSH